MKNLFKLKFPFKSSGSNETLQTPPVEVKISRWNMSNDENYFDTEGILHNQFLDFFIENTNDSEDHAAKRLPGLIESFYMQHNMPLNEVERAGYRSLLDAYAAADHQAYRPFENDDNPFPCFIEKFFNPIPVDILLSHDGRSSTDHILEFIEKIKSEESKLIKLPGNNKETRLDAIFCYYSVARYAAGYWHNCHFFSEEHAHFGLSHCSLKAPVYPVYRGAAGAAVAALMGSCRVGVAAGIAGVMAAFGTSR